MRKDPDRAAADTLADAARNAASETRSIIGDLRQDAADCAARGLRRRVGGADRRSATVQTGRVDSSSPATRWELFSVLREALANVEGHARAEAVTVMLTESGTELVLEIEDDGVGFEVPSHADTGAPTVTTVWWGWPSAPRGSAARCRCGPPQAVAPRRGAGAGQGAARRPDTPVMDGLAALEALRDPTRVLMLTYAEDEDIVADVVRAGASGYLVHGRFGPEELSEGVRTPGRRGQRRVAGRRGGGVRGGAGPDAPEVPRAPVGPRVTLSPGGSARS